MGKFDYKKEYKDLYLPKIKPMIIDVPKMLFMMIDGKGDPNTSEDYKIALESLYGLTYTIKMKGKHIKDYFEYVVPPLEGLWDTDLENIVDNRIKDKSKFKWTMMVRQPEFVTIEVFNWAKEELHKKKPDLDLSKVRLETYEERKCAQIMHIGSYDDEYISKEKLESLIFETGYEYDINEKRKHHEIYISDPRKVAAEKLKTVIRYPIKKQT